MPLKTRHTDSAADAGLAKHVVGNALVIYQPGRMSRETQELALAVAADEEHDLVVVDLPVGLPITMWESVARALPKRRRGVRLVVGGRSRETTAMAGHWLAERLGRTVLAPDGVVVRGAGGSLFVHSGSNSGWVRFQPGRPPKREAKRFPRPSWDCGVLSETFPTTARGVAEPLPGGVWIRPAAEDPQLRHNRMRIIEAMPCQQDVVSVVLGSPGGIPLNMDDVVRLWRELPDSTRDKARFIHYGPMSVPRGMVLGQLVADVLEQEVTCYTGMPTGSALAPDIRTVAGGGTFGWFSFARELAYQPSKDGSKPQAPRVVSHRLPVAGAHQLSPEVYWYSIDAVVEVVQSGLLVRPPVETPNAEAIRAIPIDPGTHNLMFDTVGEHDVERMRYLAEDLRQRLDVTTRAASRVASGTEIVGSRTEIRPAGLARQQIEDGSSEPSGGFGHEAEPTTVLLSNTPAVRPDALAAPIQLESAPLPTIESAAPNLSATAAGPDIPVQATATAASPVPPVVSVELPQPARPVLTGARLQAVPEPEASALLGKRGIEDERAWLRRTLAAEFGTMSTSVARILSQHPGFQGALSRSSAEVLTDAVAVQLYLSARGEVVDTELRAATVGPHVPFARCVVSGLGRLPSHRGPVVFATTPSDEALRLYRERQLVTEWGFTHALVGPCATQQGNTDVLVWSMTARRTKLLESPDAGVADRVVFVPGTSFKVLELTEPGESGRGLILLRELTAVEIDESGRVDQDRVSLDELALNSLRRQVETWAEQDSPARVTPEAASRFGALPGLVAE